MLMGAMRRGRGLSRSKPLVVRYASCTIAKGHILVDDETRHSG